jgi:hypothetical protein
MFGELERRRAEVDRHRENAARLAHEYHRYKSTGQGTIEFETACKFDITFIEQPYMAYGSFCDLDELGELLGNVPGDTPPLPVCGGFVTDWEVDDRGFYTAAHVAVSVYFPPLVGLVVPVDAQPVVKHHFTFSAVGFKDVPVDLRD